ncbi:hypothetical protein Tco_1466387 [Tanacetum coccineum]
MLTGKWTPMNVAVMKFNQLYEETLAHSGENDENHMARVLQLYETIVEVQSSNSFYLQIDQTSADENIEWIDVLKRSSSPSPFDYEEVDLEEFVSSYYKTLIYEMDPQSLQVGQKEMYRPWVAPKIAEMFRTRSVPKSVIEWYGYASVADYHADADYWDNWQPENEDELEDSQWSLEFYEGLVPKKESEKPGPHCCFGTFDKVLCLALCLVVTTCERSQVRVSPWRFSIKVGICGVLPHKCVNSRLAGTTFWLLVAAILYDLVASSASGISAGLVVLVGVFQRVTWVMGVTVQQVVGGRVALVHYRAAGQRPCSGFDVGMRVCGAWRRLRGCAVVGGLGKGGGSGVGTGDGVECGLGKNVGKE